MRNVYDRVWVMRDNTPKEMQILTVEVTASFWKRGTDIYYRLVSSMVGAGFGNNEGIRFKEEDVFDSKATLLESL